ncbi:DUF2141 domain-containing protein [Nitrosomonas sp. JL21]|uniref:DUF2141 domain-containing protein n=1 Tax=Nitrosomonas sp. JL21 TaxID=153949 RepID=UPI00136CE154|nr:DUF2141 domain-containing protein [Nitrosomonas sp. JL21]MBL8498137.1 DUF2141 domain-containing protein [Nitrosomonas sp.]MCC7091748.1 DUF2141 domain-containing protein [Nitrosomonas sp.]MXS77281.1 DUF2141 domain-containing protein [Nitrosomonas sp. JL21]
MKMVHFKNKPPSRQDSGFRRKFCQVASLAMLSLFIAVHADATEPSFNIKPHEVSERCDAKVAQIRVTVNNVKAGGVLNVELYDDPEHFLFKKGRKRKVRVPAAQGQQIVCMNLDRPGTYAVAVYHDRDGDRKLKKQWNLVPSEPFGLSNNPDNPSSFPKFSDSAFTTNSQGADIVVNLREAPER